MFVDICEGITTIPSKDCVTLDDTAGLLNHPTVAIMCPADNRLLLGTK